MESLSVADARDQFSELLNRAAYAKERIIVMRRNKELAALVPIEDLRIIEALEDRDDLEEARKVLATLATSLPWSEIKADLKGQASRKEGSTIKKRRGKASE